MGVVTYLDYDLSSKTEAHVGFFYVEGLKGDPVYLTFTSILTYHAYS